MIAGLVCALIAGFVQQLWSLVDGYGVGIPSMHSGLGTNPISAHATGAMGNALALFNAVFPWMYFLQVGLSALAFRMTVHSMFAFFIGAMKAKPV